MEGIGYKIGKFIGGLFDKQPRLSKEDLEFKAKWGMTRAEMIADREAKSKRTAEGMEREYGNRRPSSSPQQIRLKKWHGSQSGNCPVCDVEILAEISADTKPERYLYSNSLQLIANSVCPFCNSRIAITITKQDELEIRDKEHDRSLCEYYEKSEEMQNQLCELESDLKETDDDVKKDVISRKIDILNDKIAKQERMWEIKEDKYNDKCSVMASKAYNKYKT